MNNAMSFFKARPANALQADLLPLQPVPQFDDEKPAAKSLRAIGKKKTTAADWRDLQSRFQSLRREYGDNMAAHWISTFWTEDGEQWYVSDVNQDRERELFVALVEHAVAKLNPGAIHAFSFWLDLLRQESPSLRFPYVLSHGNADGTLTSASALTVYRVIQASADYCLRLETRGILEARSRVLRKQPSQAGRKPGKRPDPHYRDAVGNAIGRHGPEWRDHLGDIFEELDRQKIPLKGFEKVKIELGAGKQSTVSRWSEIDLVEGNQRKKIVDVLRKYRPRGINRFVVD